MLRCRGLSLNIITYMVNYFTNDFLYYTQLLPQFPSLKPPFYLLILISGDLGTHIFGIPHHGSWDPTKVARDTTETYFNTISPFQLTKQCPSSISNCFRISLLTTACIIKRYIYNLKTNLSDSGIWKCCRISLDYSR